MVKLIDLASNNISGSIPYSFGVLSKIQKFKVSGNQLYGNVVSAKNK